MVSPRQGAAIREAGEDPGHSRSTEGEGLEGAAVVQVPRALPHSLLHCRQILYQLSYKGKNGMKKKERKEGKEGGRGEEKK